MVVKRTTEEISNRVNQAKKNYPEGTLIYTVVKHVARSGMMRRIAPIVVVDGIARNISALVSDVLGWKWTDDDAIQVSGCGMDMGFHLVSRFSEEIHGHYNKFQHKHL